MNNSEVPNEGLLFLTYLIYALHAISAVGGVLSPALVITAFLFGWPSIIAIIINYMKRDATRGSFLASHFRWQIRTFWFALLWVLISWFLLITVIGAPLAILIAWVAGLWVLYRIARGLLRLMDGEAMPMPTSSTAALMAGRAGFVFKQTKINTVLQVMS